jgi:hypothetical protein
LRVNFKAFVRESRISTRRFMSAKAKILWLCEIATAVDPPAGAMGLLVTEAPFGFRISTLASALRAR